MTIIITGTGGFIGKNLLQYIKINHLFPDDFIYYVKREEKNLICFDNNYNRYFLSNINTDIVIHLGSFTPKSVADGNNVYGSLSNIVFLNQFLTELSSKPKKFIFASTLDIYENHNQILDEFSNVTPINLYAESKLYCEKILENWATQNRIVLQILRLGHIYGPGEEEYQKLIPVTIKNIINDITPIIYNNGIDRRAYLYIDDCCRLILNAIILENFVGPINIVSGNAVSIHEIVSTIISVSGKKELLIINKTNDTSKRDITFNPNKMYQYLGKEHIMLEEGLKSEFEYFNLLK